MSADRTGQKQRWLVAALGAGACVLAGVSIFRAPAVVPTPPAAPVRALEVKKVAEGRSALGEETALRDLTPLFLPTERNATLARLPTREPGKTFLDVDAPRRAVADAGWQADRALPEVVTMSGKPLKQARPLDLLDPAETDVSLAGFGRAERPVPASPARGAVVEVMALRDGRRLPAQTLGIEVPAPAKGWQPVEFFAAIGPAGLIGSLSLAAGSGVEEIDNFFRNYLAQSYRVGDRLAPGFYRITVTP